MLYAFARAMLTRDAATRVRRFYEFSDPAAEFANQHTRYINIGYWTSPDSGPDQAGADLADLLAEAASLGPEHEVLDVGCGYGEQDFHWLATGRARSITGLDVTPRHVEAAQRRAEAAGGRIAFQLGSATALPFPDGSVDRVVCLDAAMHFHPRSEFFAEAFRVLRPGGVLGLIDTIPLDGGIPRDTFRSPRFSIFRYSIPDTNWHDRVQYAAQLDSAGFTGVAVRSIREHTWEGWYRYWAGQDQDWFQDPELIRREVDLLDYVLAVARKPAAA